MIDIENATIADLESYFCDFAPFASDCVTILVVEILNRFWRDQRETISPGFCLCVHRSFVINSLIGRLGATSAAAQHGFSVKEYEKFHDVLHPLEHDALPKKDYRRIRSQANLLVKRGNAIVKLGVPSGTSEDKKEEFAKELNSFRKALAKFKADARRRDERSTQNVLQRRSRYLRDVGRNVEITSSARFAAQSPTCLE